MMVKKYFKPYRLEPVWFFIFLTKGELNEINHNQGRIKIYKEKKNN